MQDSAGARFHPDLQLPESVVIISRGVRFDQDQYSAFDQTGFDERLRQDGVKRLWVGGLAEDVCVLATVLDGRRHGFEVVLIEEATRPLTPEGSEQARRKMQRAGVEFDRDWHRTGRQRRSEDEKGIQVESLDRWLV